MGWGMRNESQDNFSALHGTVFLCRASHPHPKLYLEMQENAGARGAGEGTQLLNASRMVFPYPGCIAKISGIARTYSSWGSCCSGSLGSPAR